MSEAYVLTAAAEDDLRGIIRYTRARWGDDQVRDYLGELASGMAQLSAGLASAKDMSELHPGLRMSRCQSHYIFGLYRSDAPMLIVAILHVRMEVVARLAHRLDEPA